MRSEMNVNAIAILIDAMPVPPSLMGKLLQQSPLIIFMTVILYFLWSYIKEKNAVIKSKDNLLIEQHKTLMELYGQAVQSQSSLTLAIEELRKDIERYRKS